jgi:hypothetical protein
MKKKLISKAIKMATRSYDKLKTLCSHGEKFKFHGHGGNNTHSCGNSKDNFYFRH